jgi:hypothetical protein
MKTKIIDSLELFQKFSIKNDSFDKEIILNLTFFNNLTNTKYTKKINKYRNACGCDTGTVFMIVSILVTISYFKLNYKYFQSEYLKYLICGLVFIIACSLFGKVFGLLIAKYKLKITISEIKHHITIKL